MPKSRGRKKKKPSTRPRARSRRPGPDDRGLPPVTSLIRLVLKGGRELLDVGDPFDAEVWASQVLGLWFKVPLPPIDRIEFETKIRRETVEMAEREASPETLAVLHAFAAMEPDAIAPPARTAANRLASAGYKHRSGRMLSGHVRSPLEGGCSPTRTTTKMPITFTSGTQGKNRTQS